MRTKDSLHSKKLVRIVFHRFEMMVKNKKRVEFSFNHHIIRSSKLLVGQNRDNFADLFASHSSRLLEVAGIMIEELIDRIG